MGVKNNRKTNKGYNFSSKEKSASKNSLSVDVEYNDSFKEKTGKNTAKNNRNRVIKALSIIFILIFSAGFLYACNQEANAESYMRIHIRANSNSKEDQDIKFLIKDKVVEYLTPMIAEIESVGQLKNVLEKQTKNIENVVENQLQKNGFNYGAKVSIKNEMFPTRYYDGLLLESNFYDAIIVELGTGQGDNWWCVVYPPLCFVGSENKGTQNIIYKSKLMEIINNFFDK